MFNFSAVAPRSRVRHQEFLIEQQTRGVQGFEITFHDCLDKNTTADYYLKMLNAHVIPAFGESGIQAIGRYEVETFLVERAKMFAAGARSYLIHF